VRTRHAGVALVLAAALLLTACGGGATGSTGDGSPSPSPRPSSPAQITIVVPKEGSVLTGPSVRVRVNLTGATIVPATTKNITPTTGHLHLSLDGKLISMNYQATQTLPDVPPGQHVLQVEFVAADHLPFNPRVITAVTFTVKK
jgi:Domain of unknown function (DUF4399)